MKKRVTPWMVSGYGNRWAVERYVGHDTEWLGGWMPRKHRPGRLFETLAEAEAARDKANQRQVR